MATDHAHAAEHTEAHHGPTPATYLTVALILTVLTALEVWLYFTPAIEETKWFAPIILVLSGAKFYAVVAFYMHLRYDHRLFRGLFNGPLVIAMATIIALLLLFGQISLRLGGGA